MSAPLANESLAVEYQSLLKAVAEELKLPLTRIARQAELVALAGGPAEPVLIDVHQSASSALDLIDGYLLGLQLASGQQVLRLEPVSTVSVVYDVAQQLSKTAKHYDVELEVELSGVLTPVMANADGLRAALLSLGTAVIEAQVPTEVSPVVTLAARRHSRGVMAGCYSTSATISATDLRTATEQIPGTLHRPLKHFSAGSAAGIFVAQNIFKAMSTILFAARYHKHSGLAAILPPSRQLQLV